MYIMLNHVEWYQGRLTCLSPLTYAADSTNPRTLCTSASVAPKAQAFCHLPFLKPAKPYQYSSPPKFIPIPVSHRRWRTQQPKHLH